jgi:uncharacterized membrane protein required for colicin V production
VESSIGFCILRAFKGNLILLALPLFVLMRVEPFALPKLGLKGLNEPLIVFVELHHVLILQTISIFVNKLFMMHDLNLVVQHLCLVSTYRYVTSLPPLMQNLRKHFLAFE